MAHFLGLTEFRSQMFSNGLLYVQAICEHLGFAYIVHPYSMRESVVLSANGDCGNIAFALYQLLMKVKSQPSDIPASGLSHPDLTHAFDLLFELFLAADGERMDYVIKLSKLRSRVLSSSNIRGNPTELFRPVRGSFLNPSPNSARRHHSVKGLTDQVRSLPGVSSLVSNHSTVVEEKIADRNVPGLPRVSQILLYGATTDPLIGMDSGAGPSKAIGQKPLPSVWPGSQASLDQHKCSSDLDPRIVVPLRESWNCGETGRFADPSHPSSLWQQPAASTEKLGDVNHGTDFIGVRAKRTELAAQPGDEKVQAGDNILLRENLGSIEGFPKSELRKISANQTRVFSPSISHARRPRGLGPRTAEGLDDGSGNASEQNAVAFKEPRYRALFGDLPSSFDSICGTPALEMGKYPRSQSIITTLTPCLDATANRTCNNCSRSDTRQWVRGRKEIDEWLCHACGQYYRKNKRSRPREFWSRPIHKRAKRTDHSQVTERRDLKASCSEVSGHAKIFGKPPSACESIESADEKLTKRIGRHNEKEKRGCESRINIADAEDRSTAPSIARTLRITNPLTVAASSHVGKESIEYADDGDLATDEFVTTDSIVLARSKAYSSASHVRSTEGERSTRTASSVLDVQSGDNSQEIAQGVGTPSGRALVAALLEFAAGSER